jgi:signal transduction histidine kinase
LSTSMAQQTARFRNVHFIIATSAGLVLLVSVALGWLGWRLVLQEETLQKQQTRSRLEQNADALLAKFLRKVAETEAWLSHLPQSIPAGATGHSQPGAGGLLVSFSKSGVQVEPRGQLLYLPVTPQPVSFDASLFAAADKLEFQAADLKGAAAALTALAASKEPPVRAHALFKLAAVQRKSGQKAEAVATYSQLRDEMLMIPSLEMPYGLLSRLERAELLADSQQQAASRQEASALLAGLDSGQWPITKESYVLYETRVRKLAGQPASSHAPDLKLAVAEAVGSAWNEWQLFQQTSSRSLTKHLHSSGRVPVMTVVDANPERMVALIYAGDAISRLLLSPSTDEGENLQVSVTNEQSQTILGVISENEGAQVNRSLSAAELPWQLHVSGSGGRSAIAFPRERRNYLILALVAIVLLVALACYAMARGVLREAAAGRLQSDFVSAVSHEFRSPLTTLRQLTELLADGRIHEESRRRRYFSVLQQETSRLHQLVEDLLDFGRMDAGRRQYKFEPLDFSALVQDGIEEYQSQAGAHGHKIEIISDRSRLPVDADREALRRVVRNLLENAVKYSPDANTVWVEMGCENSAAILRVRDQGIGIPPEEKSRIFEKFVRGEAAKKACIPGTGIGLAMVKEIVRVHHGELDLDSEVGRGSTFMVRLPLSHAVSGSVQ